MKAFVTGGTGFIGSHLVDDLLREAGAEIRCLVRSDEKWLRGKPYERIIGDLHHLGVLKEAMSGVDVVIHCAGVVKARHSADFERGNVDATENVLRTAIKTGVPRVVILSSLAAAGPSDGRPLTEADPMRPVSRYGVSKQRMEDMVHRIADPQMPVTILRPAAVYGPREEDIYSFFKTASKGICPIIGDGEANPVSIVHVDDVVAAIRAACAYDHRGVDTFFIGSERAHTWNEIKDATEAALGRGLTAIRIPAGIVRNVGGLAEDVGAWFGRYPVINRDKASELVLEWTCSVDKARQRLGYTQTMDLTTGIANTIQWYRKHNWL
jgi:dihydroflavonol-4-reductase